MPETHALVVDNSPVIRKILVHVLEAQGCRVQEAEDGLAALDCIAARRPDIIFTDLIMPKIDGEKLGYIVRHTPELKDVFLVVLSGVALEDNEIVGRVHADVCIAKGPAAIMKQHILDALALYRSDVRGSGNTIQGLEGLFPREVTSELLVSKRHREVILARMTEGVLELNYEGRIVMANDAAIALIDRPEAQVLGSHLSHLLPQTDRDRFVAWMAQLEQQAQFAPLLFSYDEPVALGSLLVTFNLVPVVEEASFFIIGILQDVTGRKQLEARQRKLEKELQRIRRMEAMSLMASGISHDFNNLLTVISGNIEMARYISHHDNVNHLLDEANKALQLTSQLIRQFTTFSDNYLPQKSKVQLIDLVRENLENALVDTAIGYRLTCGDDNLSLAIDPDLVRQVFVNLIRNALDAMGEAGHIEVSVERVDGAGETARTGHTVPKGELVRIVFADSGPGIDPALADQVFDPYFSTKQKGAQKGMGLGLTIVHSIVKKHGGAVWADNAPGGGCAIILYFPVDSPNLSRQQTVAKGQGRSVLVMDDEEMMRIINKKMFEHFGCSVTVAVSGEEAISLYQRQMDGGKRFDLALLDLWVDAGMGGQEAAGKILAMDPEAVLVAISGDSSSEVMLSYANYHFAAALAKPFSIDAVKEMVHRFF